MVSGITPFWRSTWAFARALAGYSLDLRGDPPRRAAGILDGAALVLVAFLDRLLHRRSSRRERKLVGCIDVRHIDVHVGRRRWPVIGCVGEHDDGIAKLHLGVHERAARARNPPELDCAKRADEKVDGAARAG